MASLAAADPGAGFAVTVPDLTSTSTALARQHDVAATAADTASGALARTAGMAGDDPVLAAWRGRYDAVASITWLATGATAGSLHGIAVLLVDTADAYLAAEHQSTPHRTGTPERLPRPGGSRRLPAGPPPSTGPSPDAPPPDLAEYWPGGDPPRLRAAAAAWNALAEQLDDAAYRADTAFRTLLTHNHGHAFSTMAEYWRRRFAPDAFDPLYNATPRTARILGQVSRALADLVEQTRHDVENAAIDAAHDTAGAEILARLPARAAPLAGARGPRDRPAGIPLGRHRGTASRPEPDQRRRAAPDPHPRQRRDRRWTPLGSREAGQNRVPAVVERPPDHRRRAERGPRPDIPQRSCRG